MSLFTERLHLSLQILFLDAIVSLEFGYDSE